MHEMLLCFLHQCSNTDSPVQHTYYIHQHIKVLSGISLSRSLHESGGQDVWGQHHAKGNQSPAKAQIFLHVKTD